MIECKRYKSHNKGALIGFATFFVPEWNLEIRGCRVFQKDGRRWINMPSEEYMEGDEIKYASLIRIVDQDKYQWFQNEAKKAVDRYCQKVNNDETDLPF